MINCWHALTHFTCLQKRNAPNLLCLTWDLKGGGESNPTLIIPVLSLWFLSVLISLITCSGFVQNMVKGAILSKTHAEHSSLPVVPDGASNGCHCACCFFGRLPIVSICFASWWVYISLFIVQVRSACMLISFLFEFVLWLGRRTWWGFHCKCIFVHGKPN